MVRAAWRVVLCGPLFFLAPRAGRATEAIGWQQKLFVRDVELVSGPDGGLAAERAAWEDVLEVYLQGDVDAIYVFCNKVDLRFSAEAE